MVEEIRNKEEFDEKLKEAGGKLVVVDFFATWCGPCKVIAPKIEKLSKEHDDVVFLKVDVDDCGDLAEKYEVQAMPTFCFLRNATKVDAVVGANIDKITAMIQKLK